MALSQPKLSSESIALVRVFDAAADCPGVDAVIWENDQPHAIDELYTWARDRDLIVHVRHYPVTLEDGSPTKVVHEVTINTTNTITVYEK